MKAEEVISKLVEAFGTQSVFVRSEYHVQVKTKGNNDIWIKKTGQLKAKLFGDRNVIEDCSLTVIISKIQKQRKSHVEKMQEVLNLAKVVEQSEKLAESMNTLIFADAGFKDGKAKIAAVLIIGTNVIMKSKIIEVSDITIAEIEAIKFGLTLSDTVTVYNDNQSAVKQCNSDRVRWISRESNFADSFGNLRKRR